MDKPIFIIGTPRSGTTLVAKILGRHSGIFMPGETHFFSDIYSRRNEFGDPPSRRSLKIIISLLGTIYDRYNEPIDQERITNLFKDQSIQLENKISASSSYREILSLFMEDQARQLGKSRWGNNAPRDLFHIDSIMAFYPDAKIIVCTRDIRDFLLSYKYKWKTTPSKYMQYLKNLYHPVSTSLLWKASMQRVIKIGKYVPEKNLMIVRYEDLVTQPVRIAQEICDLIGERFEPDMLSIKDNNSSTPGQSEGIFTSSVGRWHTGLKPEEAWIAQYIARKELEKTGYGCERLNASYIKVACSFFSFPFALGRGLYANRSTRGPLLPYLRRRIAGFLQKA